QARSDRGKISAEFALPKRVAQNHPGHRAPTQIVLWAKQTPCGRRNAERGKKLAADPKHWAAARLADRADAFTAVSTIPGENAGEHLLVLSDFLEQRIAEIVGIMRDAPAALAVDLDPRESMRFRHWEATQTYGVQQLENGGVGAGAESQRSNNGQGESRT